MGHLCNEIRYFWGGEFANMKLQTLHVHREETTMLHSSMGITNKLSEYLFIYLMAHMDVIFIFWILDYHSRPCTSSNFHMDWFSIN